MEVGIVGLPVSGKTTLFSTLTGQEIDTTHTSGRISIHRGIVKIPDERLDKLTEIFNPRKKVPATIEYIEVGGIEKAAAKTHGLDPQLLQVLKNTDTLCLVVRAFENEYHPHPEGNVNPLRDLQIAETEFLFSDFAIVENRINRLEKQIIKTKEENDIRELELMKRCYACLEAERPLRAMEFTEEERHLMRGFQFLSAKPLVIVININEKDISREEEIISEFAEFSKKPNVAVNALCAKIEQEISQLSEEDARLFLEDLGIKEPARNKLIHTSFDLLGLISFFTHNENECRAWTIKRGTSAQKAAGLIHTDMERGFIRAEVINYRDFMEVKNLAKCREKGLLRLEGKEYPVQDGDIITIRFHV